jgi:adenosylcobinamide-GDP ribazoletransferase
MGREVQLLFCAVQFLTRLPTPHLHHFEDDWITRSAKYFPVAGLIVGAIAAATLLLAGKIWGGMVPVVLAVAAAVLVTGAFHEDGLADTADGLGGGKDAAHRLAIMKDSRIGTYGTLALILCVGLKVAALASLNGSAAAIVLFAVHGAARAAAVVGMCVLPYAGDATAAKSKPVPDGVTKVECALALILGLWPLLLLPASQALAGLGIGCLLAAVICLAARRLIGGYTGDVLGAAEQLFEVGSLLGVTVNP